MVIIACNYLSPTRARLFLTSGHANFRASFYSIDSCPNACLPACLQAHFVKSLKLLSTQIHLSLTSNFFSPKTEMYFTTDITDTQNERPTNGRKEEK
jgi:hypothetical protein